MQPYRSDLEALEARHAALEAEVADRVQKRDEAARMLDEARARQRDADVAADFVRGGPDRRRRRMFVLALAGLAVVAAFIGMARVRSRSNERDRFYARVMVQFEQFATDACKCQDSECVNGITKRMAQWGEDITRQMDTHKPPKHDESTMKHAQEIGERMANCMTKVMMGEVPAEAGSVNGAELD